MAQKKKINLMFNPSLYLAAKGAKYLQPILAATTVLVLNKEEAQAVLKTTTSTPHALLLGLQKLGPRIVVITDGAKNVSALYEEC